MGGVPSGKPGIEARLQLGPCQRPIVIGIKGCEQRLGISRALRSLRPQACDTGRE